jgi:pantoate--beta-alanine ligase
VCKVKVFYRNPTPAHKTNQMIIAKEAGTLARYIEREKTAGKTIGFVPTMGALHEGHLDLIGQSRRQTSFTVCSIFVNPTQFNNAGDFRKYPNVIGKDIAWLATAGTDILFFPSVEEVYPAGTTGLEKYDLGYLETVLEGKYRPGHFQGVCQVMHRLLTMVNPHQLFMGLKDYQQCMVVKRLLQIMESATQFIACPTIREKDGLAMSSRNLRLSPEDRQKAPAIFQCLEFIKKELKPGPLAPLKVRATEQLASKGFEADYVEIAHADTLELKESWDGKEPLVALIAAFLGDVRLIDNMMVN